MSDSTSVADSADAGSGGSARAAAHRGKGGPGLYGRIALFVRQVVAEMQKVRYPTQNELWTYFWVVLAFVAVLMAFTGLLDLGLSRLSTLVFG